MDEDRFIRSIPPELQSASNFRAHTDSVDFIRLYEQGQSPMLVSASHDKTLKIWDLASHTAVSTLTGHSEAVFCCDINEGGEIVSCSPDESVRTWDRRTAKEVSRGLGHTNKVHYVLYTAPTALVSCGRDRKLLRWDTRKMNAPVMRYGDDSSGTFRCVDYDGSKLLACTAESTLEAYDYKTGKNLYKQWVEFDPSVISEDLAAFGPPSVIYTAKMCGNGEFLTGHQDFAIRRFRFSQPPQLLSLRRAHFDAVKHIEMSSDSSLHVSTGQDGSVRVWNQDVPVLALVSHRQVASCACITRDNSRVFTSSYDQSISVFNLPSIN